VLLFDMLGYELWWQYAVLFSDDGCDDKVNLVGCVRGYLGVGHMNTLMTKVEEKVEIIMMY
jgi:hypothetical protein